MTDPVKPKKLGTPENQYTLRSEKADVVRVNQIIAAISAQSMVTPKEGDILRAIFHAGVDHYYARLGLDAPTTSTTVSVPEPVTPTPST